MNQRPPRDLARPASPLEVRLAAQIAADGPMPVERFMASALFDPELGYYRTARPIGAAGDFITAPEISQMFGEMIGLWLAQAWIDIGRPHPFDLVEFGPGRGTLMADALRAAALVPGFLPAARIGLLEINPSLRDAQAAALAASGVKVTWGSQPGELLSGLPLLLVANEFLDCMPVSQRVVIDGLLCERRIGLGAHGRLDFVVGRPLGAAPALPDGTVIEQMAGPGACLDDLCAVARVQPVRALFIDYGGADGVGDTLQAVWRHTRIHPLDCVGEADLTAHVDFGSVARFLKSQTGASTIAGPVGQGAFLKSLGIEARAGKLVAANPARAGDVAAALHRLVAPDQMGDLFNVLCLAGNGPAATPPQALPGFAAAAA